MSDTLSVSSNLAFRFSETDDASDVASHFGSETSNIAFGGVTSQVAGAVGKALDGFAKLDNSEPLASQSNIRFSAAEARQQPSTYEGQGVPSARRSRSERASETAKLVGFRSSDNADNYNRGPDEYRSKEDSSEQSDDIFSDTEDSDGAPGAVTENDALGTTNSKLQLGNFNLKSEMERPRLSANRTSAFSISETGNENLSVLLPPKTQQPQQFQVRKTSQLNPNLLLRGNKPNPVETISRFLRLRMQQSRGEWAARRKATRREQKNFGKTEDFEKF